MEAVINSIHAYEILDSRGIPTLAVEVGLSDGSKAQASVPSGISTGEYEAVELRDGDRNRYRGQGVLLAIDHINHEIAKILKGQQAQNQTKIDQMLIDLDGTENKERFGANAILGVSMGVAKAAAKSMNCPLYEYFGKKEEYLLPLPLVSVINGGAQADNSLDLEEFMIVPHKAESFREAVRMAVEVFQILGELLKDDGYQTGVGDEGGYAPRFESMEFAFDFIIRAIEKAGYRPGEDISLALDVAASELVEYEKEEPLYRFARSNGRLYSSAELIYLYQEWLKYYPIISIEDGLGENDWEGWQELTKSLGQSVQLVGDDLFVTNTSKIAQGIETGVANAVLIKLNQVGTLTETFQAINLAKQGNYKNIISHRSGETCDTTIAELAVALGLGQIKAGSVCRGERIAKYNKLLCIEDQLAERAKLYSWSFPERVS